VTSLRIGTRGSALALAQAEWVASALGDAEIVVLRTSGDDGATGDKSRWVDTIEAALVGGEIDLAVHSAKDVPGELAAGTVIVATPEREDARDVIIGARDGRIGTSSLRRRAQLAATGHVDVVDLRGNVDTRLRKLAEGEVDAIVLAAAGLRRLGRTEATTPLDFVPAPGQGVLALQARAGDSRAAALNHEETFACLTAERAAVRVLEADCHTPVGVHAAGGRMRGFVGRPDGSAWVSDEIESLDGEELGRRLLAAGAREILA
jgi:hydroxymethylbilane synthase